MLIIALQAVALALQALAAFYALRLIRITGRSLAWILIASSIALIVFRRAIAFDRVLTSAHELTVGLLTESLMLLAISLLQAIGIALIAPLFIAVKRTERILRHEHDVLETRVKERTRALEEANTALERSNRELQQFAYVASHDLQEPLRKVTAFGDRLYTHCQATIDDTGREYLERMRNATMRMRRLIDDLLEYSRVGTNAESFEAIDLQDTIHAVLDDLEQRLAECHGQVTVESLPAVLADKRQMQQLFQNLIANALKFARKQEPPCVCITGRLVDDDMVEIAVRDNGIGFEEKYLDRIFLPFQQLHARDAYGGSGIGLAICQRIVQRHHGLLTASSTPGHGATFRVHLPSADHAQGERP